MAEIKSQEPQNCFIEKLSVPLLCQILKNQTENVKEKMMNSLVSKQFYHAVNDRRSWEKDNNLTLVTKSRGVIVINRKVFKETSEAERALNKYLNLCKIRSVVCNFEIIKIVLMRCFARPIRQFGNMWISEIALQFEAQQNIDGLTYLIDILFASSPMLLITDFCLSIRSTISRTRPENVPIARKFLNTKLWNYIMNCSNLEKLNIRCECPLIVSLSVIPRVLFSLPELRDFYINIQDAIDIPTSKTITEALNKLSLNTLRMRLKMEDADQFIDDHDEERRLLITNLKITPVDNYGEHWSDTTVQRIFNSYRSLETLDINRFYAHHHWRIETIANTVRVVLLQLSHRKEPQISIRMRNHIGVDVTMRRLRHILQNVKVSYLGDFKFNCKYGRALVKLDLH